ncbi:MAG: hypothetical protein QNL12_10945 [Acidimicrobiia bacterium]|nr:hypothetical protein [Acidimicrobiia bacterium]MDX2467822.1 hypothetical protein [Acidimicrobiia bacterium]
MTFPWLSMPIAFRWPARPRPWTEVAGNSTRWWPVRTPRHRWVHDDATSTPVTIQARSVELRMMKLCDPATISDLMAKAKRRKLRARRSKANHGRRPNAGRG